MVTVYVLCQVGLSFHTCPLESRIAVSKSFSNGQPAKWIKVVRSFHRLYSNRSVSHPNFTLHFLILGQTSKRYPAFVKMRLSKLKKKMRRNSKFSPNFQLFPPATYLISPHLMVLPHLFPNALGTPAYFHEKDERAQPRNIDIRSCDRPPRHRFSLVSLCLKANAEMVPKTPSCQYMLLM